MTRSIAFIVNGETDSPLAQRARNFAVRLTSDFRIAVLYRGRRKLRAIVRLVSGLVRLRPEVVYVFDIGYSGVLAGVLYSVVGRAKLIIETGDAVSALARSLGRGVVGLWLTRWLERLALVSADHIVVRSETFRDILTRGGWPNVTVIPDGVDTRIFVPRDARDLRRRLGLGDDFVVGCVGTCSWSPTLKWCYGMELVEAMHRLGDEPVKALVVGDGDGLPRLRQRAAELGVSERVVFAGAIPYEELVAYINAMDVCLSTQTNDLAGQVRTTGKLPLYLACGRFVLATHVGEAARLLPHEMLLPCEGVIDPEYPKKLADRIRRLSRHREELAQGARGRDLAERLFDYDVLAERMKSVLTAALRSKIRS